MIKDKVATVSYFELAEYVIYSDVRVAIISPNRSEQRMAALAFGVQADDILPECGQYHAQPRRMDFEVGSKVYFLEMSELEKLRSMNLHAVCFEAMHETTRADYNLAASRVRIPNSMGVRFLGR